MIGGRRRRERFVDAIAFPPQVARAAGDGLVLDGLRDWLHVCVAGAPSQFVTLPSMAVAEAWTALLATPTWDEFLEGALGGERAHPASSLPLSEDRRLDGLWRTWTIACRREDIDDARPDRLPRLFTVDLATGARDGVAWELASAPGGPPLTRTAGPEPTTALRLRPQRARSAHLHPLGRPPGQARHLTPRSGGPEVPLLGASTGAVRSPYEMTIRRRTPQ